MKIEVVYQELLKQIERGKLVRNAPMAEYTSFKAGGVCDLLVIPENREELASAIRVCERVGAPYFLMGNGSDLLVLDGGYHGVIITLRDFFSEVQIEGAVVTAQAGALLSAVSKRCAKEGLSGLEFASGIPGSIGGAVFMNAGAYDGEMKQVLTSVTAMKRDGSIHEISADELDLGYRHSCFQENGEIVLAAEFLLKEGSREQIEERIRELTQRRNAKQPLQYPSAGSFFKRPEGYFAGKLIQDAGLSGLRLGGARISPLHAGFLINEDHATATDIVQLMRVVQNTVWDQFGIHLEPEVRMIGEELEKSSS